MTNETIRIYTASGFVFELSYDKVLELMGKHHLLEAAKKKALEIRLDVIEFVRNSTWPDIIEHLKFVGVFEDSSQDTLRESTFDLLDNPLKYATTKQKNMQFKLSKL